MIRNLRIKDAERLHTINKEQLGYDFPLNLTRKKLSKLLSDTDHHFFLWFEDSINHQILGYVHAEVYDSIYSDTLFNVLGIAVSKENDKQGIGKKLMQSLEK